MEEMKVWEYGWWTSYTYAKQNDEPSCNCFKWGGVGVAGLRGRRGKGNLTNVQSEASWNCHNESPLYNKYILIKMGKQSKLKGP
jgi:hypothetical protein